MAMISVDIEGARFNYRVAGVILSRGRVLLHRAEQDPFWALPGGRVELLEQAADSLKREMREEIAVEVDVVRLLWLTEAFFPLGGRRWHELGLYFLLALPADSPLHAAAEPFYGDEVGAEGAPIRLIYQWFPIEQLESVRLVPEFLRVGLRALPPTIEHVISIEEA